MGEMMGWLVVSQLPQLYPVRAGVCAMRNISFREAARQGH